MRFIKNTAVETVVLVVMAFAVAAIANAVRGDGSIKWARNYFDKGRVRAEVPGDSSAKPVAEHAGAKSESSADHADDTSSSPASPHPEHGYQEMTLEEVIAAFNDPNTELGLNLFVDARNDEAYAEGHIPRAIQVDHYQLENYIENALEFADVADQVIVYCNGGTCEDSIFVCGDLIGYGVPYEKVYLFAGGWKEWTRAEMPVAKGDR